MVNPSGQQLADSFHKILMPRSISGSQKRDLLRAVSEALLRLAEAQPGSQGAGGPVLLASADEANADPRSVRIDRAARELGRRAKARGETLSYAEAVRRAEQADQRMVAR